MSLAEPTSSWPELIRDACWLWLRTAESGAQKVGLDGGSRIIYAVDASVASLYSAPTRNTHNVRLLGILHDGILADLAHVLGDICLTAGEKTGGMVLLPGHDEELLEVFQAVQRDRQKFHPKHAVPDLVELLNSGILRQDIRRISALQSHSVPQNVEFIAREFEIMHGILQQEEFDVARWHDFLARGNLRTTTSPSLKLPQIPFDDPQLLELQNQWFEALTETKPASASALLIEYDAEALSTLGLINKKLAAIKDKRRIVLLTLDDALQSAAMKNPALPGARWILDPRHFLKDLPSGVGDFLADDPASRERRYDVVDWLNQFLAPFRRGGAVSAEMVRALAMTPKQNGIWRPVEAMFSRERAPDRNQRFNAIRQEWNELIRLGVNRYAINYMRRDPRMKRIASFVEEGNQVHLKEALSEYVLNALSDASVSSVVAGLYISLGKRNQNLSHTTYRMPVAIRSPDPHRREELLSFIRNAVQNKNLDEVKPITEFSEKYRVHLYYGVFFAAIGKWDATESAATSAVTFADGQRFAGRGSDIYGDEAAYLVAVALRHLVKLPTDVSRIQHALADAERRRIASGLPRADARIQAERVAVDLLQHYAVRFLGSAWRPRGRLDDIDGIVRRLQMAERALSDDDDDLFRRIVSKQIHANVLSATIIDYMTNSTNDGLWTRPLFQNSLDKAIALRAQLLGGSSLEQAAQSRYLDILIDYSSWLAGREIDLNGLVNALGKAEADPPEMPYDEPKYQWMRNSLTRNPPGSTGR